MLVDARQQREGGGAGLRVAAAAARHRDAVVAAALLEDVAGLERRRDRDQLRVHRRAVHALVVVLEQDLPVRGDLADRLVARCAARRSRSARTRPPTLRPARAGCRADPASGSPRWTKTNPSHTSTVTGQSPNSRAVDLVLLHERCADQPPVERIAPRVVRALDRAAQPPGRLLVAQARAAMAADVVEAAQLAVLAADDQDALADDVDGQELARLGERIDPARVEPVAGRKPARARASKTSGAW